MRTRLRAAEAGLLPKIAHPLPAPPSYITDPFKSGKVIWKYRPSDLKKEALKSPSDRTQWLYQSLRRLAPKHRGRFPYAFKDRSGTVRALDAGCLAHLAKATPKLISFLTDAEGYISAVSVVGPSGRTYTVEGLARDGAMRTLQILIDAAEREATVSYGMIAQVLENDLRIPKIYSRHIGSVVGSLMNQIQEIEPSAPLINALVVGADSKLPGDGADRYLKDRFGWIGEQKSKRRKYIVDQASREAWDYQYWRKVFRRLFSTGYEQTIGGMRKKQYDKDGKGDNPAYRGGDAESEEHKALKAFVANNPSALGLGLGRQRGIQERRLLSGDEMDVEFSDPAQIVAVEVKSIRSGVLDLQRGIYQCIKYRAVLSAQLGNSSPQKVVAALVTERKLPLDLAKLAREHKVVTRVIKINKPPFD